MEAIRKSPWRRIETNTATTPSVQLSSVAYHPEAKLPLGLLDPALEVADRVHLGEVDADGDQGPGDLGGESRDDHTGTHQPRRVDGLHEVVGDGRVDLGDTGDVDHDDLGSVGADAAQQLVGELCRPLTVQDADDREDQQPLADLQHWRAELTDGVLLLADDPLALLDEADGDGVGDAVGGWLVHVQDPVQHREVVVVLEEQRPGQHVAQQQDDANDLVGLDAARDDPLGQVPGVALQRVDAAGLEHLDVVVVDGGGLGADLLWRHRLQQAGGVDAIHPLLAELAAVLSEVLDQFRQEDVIVPRRPVVRTFICPRHGRLLSSRRCFPATAITCGATSSW